MEQSPLLRRGFEHYVDDVHDVERWQGGAIIEITGKERDLE